MTAPALDHKELCLMGRLGYVLNREEQLPRLAETNRSTRQVGPCLLVSSTKPIPVESGHRHCGTMIGHSGWSQRSWMTKSHRQTRRDGTMFVMRATLWSPHSSQWDQIIFKGSDPYDPTSWTIPAHFNFEGYDTSPFWDDDGNSYLTGSHAWQVW